MRSRNLANIPAMPWKDSMPPNTPSHFTATNDSDAVFNIRWQRPARAIDGDTARFYDVYRSTTQPVNVEDARNLICVIANNETTFVDTICHPTSIKYFYVVTALDKGNNESAPTKEEGIVVPEIVKLAQRFSNEVRLVQAYPDPASEYVYIPYELKDSSLVWLTLQDSTSNEVAHLVDAVQTAGRYITGADVSHLKDGTYMFQLTVGSRTLKRALTIEH